MYTPFPRASRQYGLYLAKASTLSPALDLLFGALGTARLANNTGMMPLMMLKSKHGGSPMTWSSCRRFSMGLKGRQKNVERDTR
jgi:hypothetical protein